MPNLNQFPDFFEEYCWENKHNLYGYEADRFPDFSWILSLEQRFSWLRKNCAAKEMASIYLVREMIQWGGSQNGVLQKFEDRLGEVNLQEILKTTITRIGDPKAAIEAALQLPGMGLTYASKLLRFLDPENYGALDSRIRGALDKYVKNSGIQKINDGNLNSMTKGYSNFVTYLEQVKASLETAGIIRPTCALPLGQGETGWRAADIEMALFCWAERNEP